MYVRRTDIKPFDKKVWLASPTMHGDELKYITEAYDSNWMSTVGANINEVEHIAAQKAEMKYAVALSSCTAALHLCVRAAGEPALRKTCHRPRRSGGQAGVLLRHDLRRHAEPGGL